MQIVRIALVEIHHQRQGSRGRSRPARREEQALQLLAQRVVGHQPNFRPAKIILLRIQGRYGCRCRFGLGNVPQIRGFLHGFASENQCRAGFGGHCAGVAVRSEGQGIPGLGAVVEPAVAGRFGGFVKPGNQPRSFLQVALFRTFQQDTPARFGRSALAAGEAIGFVLARRIAGPQIVGVVHHHQAVFPRESPHPVSIRNARQVVLFVVQQGTNAGGSQTYRRIREVPGAVLPFPRVPSKRVAAGRTDARRFQHPLPQRNGAAGRQIEGLCVARNWGFVRALPFVGGVVHPDGPIGKALCVVARFPPIGSFYRPEPVVGQGESALKGALLVFLFVDQLHRLNLRVAPTPNVQGELFFVQERVFFCGLGHGTIAHQEPALVVRKNQRLVRRRFVQRRQVGVAGLQPDLRFSRGVPAQFVPTDQRFSGVCRVHPSQVGAFGMHGELRHLLHPLVQKGPAGGGPTPNLGRSLSFAQLGLPGEQYGCIVRPNKGLGAGQGVRFSAGQIPNVEGVSLRFFGVLLFPGGVGCRRPGHYTLCIFGQGASTRTPQRVDFPRG